MKTIRVWLEGNLSVVVNYKITTIFSRRLATEHNLLQDDLQKKIIYNCELTQNDIRYRTPSERRFFKSQLVKREFLNHGDIRPIASDPACLKYLENVESSETVPKTVENQIKEVIQFPFDRNDSVLSDHNLTASGRASEEVHNDVTWESSSKEIVKKLVKDKNWIPHNPDVLNDAVSVEGENVNLKYGTSDPNIPVSNINCGGCGALLHCQEAAIPGFLPKEMFQGLTNPELKTLVCQRCHFLKEYDIALGVDVSPDDYPKILAPIKNQKALVLLMVDLLDIPCSIWPGIMDIIGHKRPIVVVGNKIDLLIQDGPKFLDNVRASLKDSLLDAGMPSYNIKHIALISAKSGYGVENLITQIHTSWQNQGDIYIVGCTNVGKSTLFNTLIQSDLCKVQAVDLMQRATVSEWPGTTLNLLKFPILRPSHWRLFVRKSRMVDAEKQELEALALRNERKKARNCKLTVLTGNVGRSFLPENLMEKTSDPFSVAISNNPRGVSPLGLNPENKVFKDSKWCYDTPGVVHPDQILNLLTTTEIMATLPKTLVVPRTIHLKPGYSILIAGLARLDFLSGPDYIWLSVFAAQTLPLTVTKTEDVDDVYRELLGTNILKVPSGGSERLEKWPSLAEKTIEITGKYVDEAAIDLVLSSAGWVAVTLKPAEFCVLRAWTPGGRGIHSRIPYLKKAHKIRGPRIQNTPVFKPISIV